MRDLSGPPPDYRLPGWQPGGFQWIRPWAQLIRLQQGQIVANSRNGLHSGEQYYGAVAGPHATRVLQSGTTTPSATNTMPNPGVQSTLPLAANPGLSARPTVIGPQ